MSQDNVLKENDLDKLKAIILLKLLLQNFKNNLKDYCINSDKGTKTDQ